MPLPHSTLSGRVSELQEQVKLLQEELNKSKNELANERGVQSSHKVALERENDLLREQLKKYVSIVQAQRNPSSSTSETSGRQASKQCFLQRGGSSSRQACDQSESSGRQALSIN